MNEEQTVSDNTNNLESPNAQPNLPAPSIPTSELPFPLTFFLTAAQRAAVLRRLSSLHEDRVTALLISLELTSPLQ